MNETEQQSNTAAPAPQATAATTTPTASAEEAKPKKGCRKRIAIIVTVAIVLGGLLGLLYVMEKDGKSSTTVFKGLIDWQSTNAKVALVNGVTISGADLDESIEQFRQMAAAQGVDIESEGMQEEVRSQAIDVLINTELLKQSAAEKGVEVTNEEVAARINDLEAQIGGAEAMAERMAELGIDDTKLREDIAEEILIQGMLDIIFAEADTTVTDEEVQQVYDSYGGEAAGLPALADVSEEIVVQLQTSKEQAAIDDYLAELKAGAEIEQF